MMNQKKLIDSIAISATAKFDIDQFLNNDKTISQYAPLVLGKQYFHYLQTRLANAVKEKIMRYY